MPYRSFWLSSFAFHIVKKGENCVIKRIATVKCSASRLEAAALVLTLFLRHLLGSKRSLELDCDKYHLKRGVLAINISLLTSASCGESRYL